MDLTCLDENQTRWWCFQLGAREHYSVPLWLFRQGRLEGFATDLWVPHTLRVLRRIKRVETRLRGRNLEGLRGAPIYSCTLNESLVRLVRVFQRRGSVWPELIGANRRFSSWGASLLRRRSSAAGGQAVFAYSYAAQAILQQARDMGHLTVMGQIDPGPSEWDIVRRLHVAWPQYSLGLDAPPSSYWDNWRQECLLADRIVVNSSWSNEGLLGAGVAADKLVTLPLSYDPPPGSEVFKREYPERFSRHRPLRVLYLGSLTLRKGIAEVLEAAHRLAGDPIEFRLVGSLDIRLPDWVRWAGNLKILGAVPRTETAPHYQWADVFLFPTHSDGFGMTQLEARAWKLPAIVSHNCARVTRDGVDGRILEVVSVESVVQELQRLIAKPALCVRYASALVPSSS